MSDEVSARLALPYLQPGQAQKEVYHNEALALIDLAIQPAVRGIAVDTPPTGPAPGECWIAGAAPTGAWAGKANQLAGWTQGGWRFVAPFPGMVVWSIADALEVRFTGAAWTLGVESAAQLVIGGVQVVGAREASIATPAGGALVDAEARAAIGSVLGALRSHGLIAS